MAEREHFTNGRCFAFGTGLALMGTSFGVQVSGWSHWVTIGIGYGIGVVLMLIAAVLITKSYFSRSHELPPIAPLPIPVSAAELPKFKQVDNGDRLPQSLRDQITVLAGDLCGYLIAHGKELNPPDDPNTTGFEFIWDEPDIVSTFEQEFGAHLTAVRTGLGNVGMLLGNIGEVLENGATNADDVRRIVDRLKDSVGLLDSRCGTKAPPATVQPDPYAGLFTPLQLKMLSLRKDLIALLASELRVERDAFNGPDADVRYVTVSNRQDERFTSAYIVNLKAKTVALFHELRLKGIPDNGMISLAENARFAPQFEQMIEMLWVLAGRLDGPWKPKYSERQIQTMPLSESEELLRSKDPEYAAAVRHHFPQGGKQ